MSAPKYTLLHQANPCKMTVGIIHIDALAFAPHSEYVVVGSAGLLTRLPSLVQLYTPGSRNETQEEPM